MNEYDRKELVNLLGMLELNEVHSAVACALERHDKVNAMRLLRVEQAIDNLIRYLKED